MFLFLSKPNPLMMNVPSFILSIVGGRKRNLLYLVISKRRSQQPSVIPHSLYFYVHVLRNLLTK